VKCTKIIKRFVELFASLCCRIRPIFEADDQNCLWINHSEEPSSLLENYPSNPIFI